MANHLAREQIGRVSTIRILLAVLLPPLGVFFTTRFGKHFWISLLMTILGYVPGIIHAVWFILNPQIPEEFHNRSAGAV